jgi:ATP-dependent DNA helicase RecQ
MPDQANPSPKTSGFSTRCLSLDLEVGVRDTRIHQFAAVRGDSGEAFTHHKGNLPAALTRLDHFATGLTCLLGHNLLAFDLPHLSAAQPGLQLLRFPAVDTLRLNPLAFPRNPYHHLVKHYQDGQLKRGRINDPELDARLTLEVFRDQGNAFTAWHTSDPDRLLAWHWLTTQDGQAAGFDAMFTAIRRQPRPTGAEARQVISKLLQNCACQTHSRTLLESVNGQGWALAYTLAWLAVAGGNSVMPPWIRHQFPVTAQMVKQLRDTPCDDPTCLWCRQRHDAQHELHRWFPHIPGFRPEPTDQHGVSLQRAIVEAALRGEHVLGILPTGTGKSICYQLPALSRFDKTGALTVVISPLVALMADQVAGLEAKGITACAAINGLLSMPERADVLDRVRLGDIGILLIAPEQLRSKTLRKVLEQREIGAWVLDEAHCISKWGHDFRPDYRYVGRFIRQKAGNNPIPPILCLTATAKPEVVADIIAHFRDKVGVELQLFDGGASRHNLAFAVLQTTPAEKFAHVHQVLLQYLPPDQPGGAIVYCATRKQTEDLAEFLQDKGIAADHFHSMLKPERKKTVQDRFIRGELRAIAATNAFGMGIDKPDVRLVIHADIPGSLENYLQEAGRAGRDREAAHCVLLYTPEDVERQFIMSARSRLSRTDIQSILKALRKLDRKKHTNGEVIATTGEILMEEEDSKFERDSATDDTRVRTAIAWLEEATLLTREENQVQVFPSSLRVASIEQARERLAKTPLRDDYRHQLLAVISTLISADADEGVSTDELMGASGLTTETVRKALYDLEQLGLASNDTALTVFVHSGVERSSRKRFAAAVELETALLATLRETAPDVGKGESSLLHLRIAAQKLKDAGHPDALPERLGRIIRSLANDGRGDDGGNGSVRVRRIDAETLEIHLLRDWPTLCKTAELRRTAASHLLQHLLACLPNGARGTDLLAETTLGKLLTALKADLMLCAEVREPPRLLDRALLWLHEQEVIRLNKGLAVFRPAMTLHLGQDKRSFAKPDFAPLKLHYDEQVVQIHVMAEYVRRGLKAIAEALQLAMDYFTHSREAFLKRWLPEQDQEQLHRQTTPESWQRIVEDLNNPLQQRIVTDEREQTNVLVLAGPGSGKTRVLVHRIAWLVRVKRENPHGILALAYNRHAAVEIRQRLHKLIGNDANGVTVLTCHALAMRLSGVSLAQRLHKRDDIGAEVFRDILQQAVDLLNGNGLPPEEADEQRERLLAGFRWILVDEYQDIGAEQYALIAALAGRSLQDEDSKLSLFAVGDDDQNIYAFDGASVAYIRRFGQDYNAKPVFLTENYRSTAHIIHVANGLIAPALNRMKADNPIIPDRNRRKASPGGDWQALDVVAQGRVQILPAGNNPTEQALLVMAELRRLASLDPDWHWEQCAVIAREWQYLEPVRAYCEWQQIPVQMADAESAQFWRLRETRTA